MAVSWKDLEKFEKVNGQAYMAATGNAAFTQSPLTIAGVCRLLWCTREYKEIEKAAKKASKS